MRERAIRQLGDALRAARRHHHRRLRRIAACAALIGAVGVSAALPPSPRLLWNASASAPIGLWSVAPNVPLRRGDMVVARLAAPWRDLAARRRYLPANVPLLKRVAAEPGDRVCAIGADIVVNGQRVAVRRSRDAAGRTLPWWGGCLILGNGAIFLLTDDPGSFDGRYFGPIGRGGIVGKARPLWLR